MKVILRDRVQGLGEAGAIVEVAAGHARNLLFPRGLAEEATAENLARREAALNRRAKAAQRELEAAKAAASKLAGHDLTIRAKAGESGRLFGSVTAGDVADAVTRQYGITIDRRRVEMHEPFKTLGQHNVTLRLHAEVAVTVAVNVEPA